MVLLGGGAFSYERGTPVKQVPQVEDGDVRRRMVHHLALGSLKVCLSLILSLSLTHPLSLPLSPSFSPSLTLSLSPHGFGCRVSGADGAQLRSRQPQGLSCAWPATSRSIMCGYCLQNLPILVKNNRKTQVKNDFLADGAQPRARQPQGLIKPEIFRIVSL